MDEIDGQTPLRDASTYSNVKMDTVARMTVNGNHDCVKCVVADNGSTYSNTRYLNDSNI
jgi:hypothetical protein